MMDYHDLLTYLFFDNFLPPFVPKFEPAHEIMVVITLATSEVSGEPAHPEHLLFAHIKYGSRRRVRPKIRHLAQLDDCPCAFE